MESMQFRILGMNRDNALSFPNKQENTTLSKAYEIYNMRVVATENETSFALTNERGTKRILDKSIKSVISGNVIGAAVLNDILYVFTHEEVDEGDSKVKKDRLFRIPINEDGEIPTNEAGTISLVTQLFVDPETGKGYVDLDLDFEHPLDIIPYFETEDSQKLYWIDGKNQPRMFDVCSKNMTIDFLPKVDIGTEITITKQQGGGVFPAGVIQYAFTMGVQNGQESNIFYVSPLYYITRDNTYGLPVGENSNCSFKIEFPNIEWGTYDFVNVYSILRTSIDGEADCRRVQRIYKSDCSTKTETITKTIRTYTADELQPSTISNNTFSISGTGIYTKPDTPPTTPSVTVQPNTTSGARYAKAELVVETGYVWGKIQGNTQISYDNCYDLSYTDEKTPIGNTGTLEIEFKLTNVTGKYVTVRNGIDSEHLLGPKFYTSSWWEAVVEVGLQETTDAGTYRMAPNNSDLITGVSVTLDGNGNKVLTVEAKATFNLSNRHSANSKLQPIFIVNVPSSQHFDSTVDAPAMEIDPPDMCRVTATIEGEILAENVTMNVEKINAGAYQETTYTIKDVSENIAVEVQDNKSVVDTHSSYQPTIDVGHLLLTCQRNKTIPQTLEVKNNTLFLGNLITDVPIIDESLKKILNDNVVPYSAESNVGGYYYFSYASTISGDLKDWVLLDAETDKLEFTKDRTYSEYLVAVPKDSNFYPSDTVNIWENQGEQPIELTETVGGSTNTISQDCAIWKLTFDSSSSEGPKANMHRGEGKLGISRELPWGNKIPNSPEEEDVLWRNSQDLKIFKGNEQYQFGLQFKDKYQQLSEIYPISSTFAIPQLETNTTSVNTYYPAYEISAEALDSLKAGGYDQARLVMMDLFPQERQVIDQGIISPTIYDLGLRVKNTPYAMASWFFRCCNDTELPWLHNKFLKTNQEDSSNGEIQSIDKQFTLDDVLAEASDQLRVTIEGDVVFRDCTRASLDDLGAFVGSIKYDFILAPYIEKDTSVYFDFDAAVWSGYSGYLVPFFNVAEATTNPASGTLKTNLSQNQLNIISNKGTSETLYYYTSNGSQEGYHIAVASGTELFNKDNILFTNTIYQYDNEDKNTIKLGQIKTAGYDTNQLTLQDYASDWSNISGATFSEDEETQTLIVHYNRFDSQKLYRVKDNNSAVLNVWYFKFAEPKSFKLGVGFEAYKLHGEGTEASVGIDLGGRTSTVDDIKFFGGEWDSKTGFYCPEDFIKVRAKHNDRTTAVDMQHWRFQGDDRARIKNNNVGIFSKEDSLDTHQYGFSNTNPDTYITNRAGGSYILSQIFENITPRLDSLETILDGYLKADTPIYWWEHGKNSHKHLRAYDWLTLDIVENVLYSKNNGSAPTTLRYAAITALNNIDSSSTADLLRNNYLHYARWKVLKDLGATMTENLWTWSGTRGLNMPSYTLADQSRYSALLKRAADLKLYSNRNEWRKSLQAVSGTLLASDETAYNNTSIKYQFTVQGDTDAHIFGVDSRIQSYYSPNVENISSLVQYNNNIKVVCNNEVKRQHNRSWQIVSTKSSAHLASYVKGAISNQSGDLGSRLLTYPMYQDDFTNSIISAVENTGASPIYFPVYPWHRTASLGAQCSTITAEALDGKNNSEKTALGDYVKWYGELEYKIISNAGMFGNTTNSIPITEISEVGINYYPKENSILRLYNDTRTTMSNPIYQGDVDLAYVYNPVADISYSGWHLTRYTAAPTEFIQNYKEWSIIQAVKGEIAPYSTTSGDVPLFQDPIIIRYKSTPHLILSFDAPLFLGEEETATFMNAPGENSTYSEGILNSADFSVNSIPIIELQQKEIYRDINPNRTWIPIGDWQEIKGTEGSIVSGVVLENVTPQFIASVIDGDLKENTIKDVTTYTISNWSSIKTKVVSSSEDTVITIKDLFTANDSNQVITGVSINDIEGDNDGGEVAIANSSTTIKNYDNFQALLEYVFEDLISAKEYLSPMLDSVIDNGDMIISGTEGDHFYGRWECLKTYALNDKDPNQVVDIVSVPLESPINLHARTDRNRGAIDNTVMSPNNFNIFNDVYNQSNNFFSYQALSVEDGSSNKLFNNQIIWSLEKHNGEEVDSWTTITTNSFVDLDGANGKLNKIIDWQGKLLAFQDKAITYIPFDVRTAIGTSDGVPIEIANGGKVAESPQVLHKRAGCQNKWSVCVSPNFLYYIDNYNEGLYRLREPAAVPESITDNEGFRSWMHENNTLKVWNSIDQSNFKTSYDTINKELYIINSGNCLVFNEALDMFTSFYSYEGVPYIANVNNHLFGITNNQYEIQKTSEEYSLKLPYNIAPYSGVFYIFGIPTSGTFYLTNLMQKDESYFTYYSSYLISSIIVSGSEFSSKTGANLMNIAGTQLQTELVHSKYVLKTTSPYANEYVTSSVLMFNGSSVPASSAWLFVPYNNNINVHNLTYSSQEQWLNVSYDNTLLANLPAAEIKSFILSGSIAYDFNVDTFWAGYYNNFFGTQQPYYLTFIANDNSQATKIFNTISYTADSSDCKFEGDIWASSIYQYSGSFKNFGYLPQVSFNYIKAENEYQRGAYYISNDVTEEISPYPLKKKFRVWNIEIPRDGDTATKTGIKSNTRADRMSNPWLKITLGRDNNDITYSTESSRVTKNDPGSNARMDLHEMTLFYTLQ